MSGGSSEEKELPASQRKLRKAREKGQVAHSSDLTTALALIVAVVYLISSLGELIGQLMEIWRAPIDFHDAGLETAIRLNSVRFFAAAWHFLIPLFAAMVIASYLAEAVMKQGFVFSFEPVMPNLEKIDPMKGVQKLFKVNKLIELVKALIKLAVLGTGGAMALRAHLDDLLWVPSCGLGCAGQVWAGLVKFLAGLAILVFAVNGLIDMRLQIWLFLRDQRMTKTEQKRERKDQSQSPEIRRAVRQQAQPKKQAKVGAQHATLVLGNSSVAIGIRFVADETPAPVCVCKGRGPAAKRILAEADDHGIPVHTDAAFADALFKNTRLAATLPAASYRVIAQIFKQYKII